VKLDAEIARLRREKDAADRRLIRLRGLTRLSGLIAASLDLDAVLSEIARAAAELMEAPAVGLWVADEATRTLERVGREAMHVLGQHAYDGSNRVERIYREARIFAIGGGTEEILDDLAARQLGIF